MTDTGALVNIIAVGPQNYVVGPGALVQEVPTLDAGLLVYVEELSGEIRLLTSSGELPVPVELGRLARERYFSGND